MIASYGYNDTQDSRINSFNEGTNAALPPSDNPTVTTYNYDWLGHLTGDVRTGNLPYAIYYAVNAVGDRTAQTVNGVAYDLHLDADAELTGVTGGTTNAYTYDADGRQIGSTVNGQSSTFGYDYDGSLTSLNAAGAVSTFAYDGLGRQIRRTAGGHTSGYFMDGGTVLMEQTDGVTTDQYTYGLGEIRHNGEYPLYDGTGSQRQVSDGSQAVTAGLETTVPTLPK